MTKTILALACIIATASSVQAQEWVIGAGYEDFSDPVSIDQGILTFEYHFEPYHTRERFSAGFAGTLSVDGEGDVFAGVGFAGVYKLKDGWFLEGSVMPGAYFESTEENDLGSRFEIRSLIGVGYTLESGNKISLAATHKSNASTADTNPGVNALLIRFRSAF
jgi:hypothetical protein